jgi:hypothetical protein
MNFLLMTFESAEREARSLPVDSLPPPGARVFAERIDRRCRPGGVRSMVARKDDRLLTGS